MRDAERPPADFLAEFYLEPRFEFPEWFDLMLLADILFYSNECVDDLSVLLLCVIRLDAELASPACPLLLLAEFMDTDELPNA